MSLVLGLSWVSLPISGWFSKPRSRSLSKLTFPSKAGTTPTRVTLQPRGGGCDLSGGPDQTGPPGFEQLGRGSRSETPAHCSPVVYTLLTAQPQLTAALWPLARWRATSEKAFSLCTVCVHHPFGGDNRIFNNLQIGVTECWITFGNPRVPVFFTIGAVKSKCELRQWWYCWYLSRSEMENQRRKGWFFFNNGVNVQNRNGPDNLRLFRMRPGVKSKIMCILIFIQCDKICSLARSVNTQFYMYDMKITRNMMMTMTIILMGMMHISKK